MGGFFKKRFENFKEKEAAKNNAGFAAFRSGKELYFAFVRKHGEKYGCGTGDASLKMAYEYYCTAAQGADMDKRFADVARTYVELGKVCELLGEYGKSIEHRRKAIELFEAMPDISDGDRESVRDSYMYLAMSLFHNNEKDEALRIAKIGLKKYEQANDPYGIKTLSDLIEKIESENN